jgi:hypothetical protein
LLGKLHVVLGVPTPRFLCLLALLKQRRTGWLASFRRNGYYVRHVAIVTLLMGASVHLAVVALGRSALPRIVTPPFELLLTVLIA